jgi:hypothetical protein
MGFTAHAMLQINSAQNAFRLAVRLGTIFAVLNDTRRRNRRTPLSHHRS